MFNYTYDEKTGGILLNDKATIFSKEPRPVYAQELDFLGIDEFYEYDKQQDYPYMWAEANHYIYKGKRIFDVKGGSLYEKPSVTLINNETPNENGEFIKVLPPKSKLEIVDIKTMVEKNRDMLDIIEQITVKKIYEVYKKYKNKLDCFHVALSGGKDSIVLLALTEKALPNNSFIVVFGDTGMEFPDTYNAIDKLESHCKKVGISFYRASSHLKPEESWRLFGPPSRTLRWCCHVHKSAVQTLRIREILGKDDYVGMDFVGVRKHESVARSTYDEENFGKKQKGQYSFNSILEWTSAEVWLYIYANNLVINEAYKKGNSRAGCLFCPMGGGKGDYFQHCSYLNEVDKFIDIIKETNERDFGNPKALNSYVSNGGWNARKNGRDLTINESHYSEEVIDGVIKIKITNPSTDWQEWIKTLGDVSFTYNIEYTKNGYIVTVLESAFKKNPTLKRKFKQVFKKSAYCVGCRVCETNCRNGCISFENGLHIKDCIHCGQCHEIVDGCLAYNSLKTPLGGTKKMGSINSFANHAPKEEWIADFIEKGNTFWDNNTLGRQEVPLFRKFLKFAGILNNDNKTTAIYDLLSNGYDTAWGYSMVDFAYNPQFHWYIDNMPINEEIPRKEFSEMLINDGVAKRDTSSIIGAFKRFTKMAYGDFLGFGKVSYNKNEQVTSLTRCKCVNVDDRVILYALYKYAEKCDGYYSFSLNTLMDINNGSTGISPIKIFGISHDEMEIILRRLSANYNEYINVSFTHDLEKISLRDYHTSSEIIGLIKE